MDFKNVDVKALKTDLVKNATIMIVSQVLRFYLASNSEQSQKSLMSILTDNNNDFTYHVILTLLAFVVYHVVVVPAVVVNL